VLIRMQTYIINQDSYQLDIWFCIK